MSSRIEEKFTKKLEDPFYKESIKISDRPLTKLLVRIRKVASSIDNEADKEQFLSEVLCKSFFSFYRAGKSSSITTLLKSATDLKELQASSWKLIEWYAEHPLRASISSMYNNLGMPDRREVEELVAWCSDDKGKLNEKLFSSITGMQAGSGSPDLKALGALKDFCIENDTFNQDLFRSITGMQAGRGMPNLSALTAVKDFCTEGEKFNQALFSSITGMQCRCGVPMLSELTALKDFCTENDKFNQALFSSITGMQGGCGMPKLLDLEALKGFCTENEKFNQALFSSITGMQNSRGVPDLKAIGALKDFCTENGEFNQELFRWSVQRQHKLGIPSLEEFKHLKALYYEQTAA